MTHFCHIMVTQVSTIHHLTAILVFLAIQDMQMRVLTRIHHLLNQLQTHIQALLIHKLRLHIQAEMLVLQEVVLVNPSHLLLHLDQVCQMARIKFQINIFHPIDVCTHKEEQ